MEEEKREIHSNDNITQGTADTQQKVELNVSTSEETPTIHTEEKKSFWRQGFLKETIDFVRDLVIIVVIVVIIRTFFILPFQINGQSMYDSYYDKEFIIVDRFSYIVGEPERGDVIIFKPHVSVEREYFIKRIIGLPGEQIKIEGGKVYLFDPNKNDYTELYEDYLSGANTDSTFIHGDNDSFIYTIPTDSYFVMGDNRLASTDSRTCFSNCSIPGKTNYIVKKDMIGKVFLDLGYINFKEFNFVHPVLGVDTTPRFFSSPSHYDYR